VVIGDDHCVDFANLFVALIVVACITAMVWVYASSTPWDQTIQVHTR
jgi:hypothetical protein